MYTENNTEPQDITSQVPVTEEEAFKILAEIIAEGYFTPRIFDARLRALFTERYRQQQ